MWFEQFTLTTLEGTVYVIWQSEEGKWYQGTMGNIDAETIIEL